MFISNLMHHQSPQEQERLPRSKVELAFIRATRGDAGQGLRGTLCRGEFFECMMRLCHQWVKAPQKIAEYLEAFFDTYVTPQLKDCTIV